MWFIGVEVELIQRRVHPLLKKILDPPLKGMPFFIFISFIFVGIKRLQ